MAPDLLYKIALSLIPNIGPVQARILIDAVGEAKSVFTSNPNRLKNIEGIGEIRAKSIREFSRFKQAENEIIFIEKFKVKPLFITDPGYPRRLLNCYDSPTLLYYKGNSDLNHSRVLAVIGTRNNTAYGTQLTEQLMEELSEKQVLIVSGLAYGIDSIAHKAAISNNLATIGVLAHGLDIIYPSQHALLAREMVAHGGLLTEFRSNTNPDKHNFPSRNRIVAGISDAILVVETGNKGGSLITAEIANSYNRDVFAYPGKLTDAKSAGCNALIRDNKAILLTGTQELLEIMGWSEQRKPIPKFQKELFIELSPEEKLIIDIIREKDTVHIDEINQKCQLSTSVIASAILNLELQNLVNSLPGKRYSLQ